MNEELVTITKVDLLLLKETFERVDDFLGSIDGPRGNLATCVEDALLVLETILE